MEFQFECIKWGKQLDASILDIQPLVTIPHAFLAVTETGNVFELNIRLNSIELIYTITNEDIDFQECVSLVISPNNKLICVFNSRGRYGTVIDLVQNKEVLRLTRDDYYFSQTNFPIAFIDFNDQTLLIHGTKWNRLDITDPSTGKLLTTRTDPVYENTDNEQPSTEHYLDYFHGQLSVSPDNSWLVDNGWEWHPLGTVVAWNMKKWIENNVWESEDGNSKKTLWWGKYDWNDPMCWVSDHEIGIMSRNDPDLYDGDDHGSISSDWEFRIFDVCEGVEVKRFNITPGKLFYDEYLYCLIQDSGFKIYDTLTGKEIYDNEGIDIQVFHNKSKEFLSISNNEITVCHLFKQ